MKIEITQAVCVDGLRYVPGDVVEAESVHPGTLPNLLRLGQAKELPPEPQPPEPPKAQKAFGKPKNS